MDDLFCNKLVLTIKAPSFLVITKGSLSRKPYENVPIIPIHLDNYPLAGSPCLWTPIFLDYLTEHVFAPGKDVVEVENKLIKFVPKEFKVDIHHWFFLHGRYVCTARKPICGACIIEDLCEFKEKTD